MAQMTAVTGEITHGRDTTYGPTLYVRCRDLSNHQQQSGPNEKDNTSPPMAALFSVLSRPSGTRHHLGVAVTGLGRADLTTAINPPRVSGDDVTVRAGGKAAA